MSRPKKKPNYDADRSMRELTNQVVASYGEAYDDRYSLEQDQVSLRNVAAEYKITLLKARIILITARMFSTATSRYIQKLANGAASVRQRRSLSPGISDNNGTENVPGRNQTAA